MNAQRRQQQKSARHVSTAPAGADMLAAARPRLARAAMTAEREFSDGEVVPGTRYRVIGLIGAGGMGSVYEVEHVELGKRFVLKALLRGLATRDDLVHRLRNEWRALGRLEHVSIVGVTDAGVSTTGVPYYVMERLQGETLATRLRRLRRLPAKDALGIAADVLDGLHAAHQIDIVHRDVKPPNIFLVAGKGAKLLDFGIAKMLDPKASQITGRGIAIGTPRYMSPEQASGAKVDLRSDLYSTGVILFEMIAGAGPFDHARDTNDLFLAQLTQDPPALSRVVAIPRELDRIVTQLLSKKPEDRPVAAADVSKTLRAIAATLTSAPVSSRQPVDDVTIPGGPFDTLEGAATIPSEPGADPGQFDAAPRSHGLKESRRPSGAPSRRSTPSRDGELGGATLRLDAFEAQGLDGTATHTAAPRPASAVVETPPPVEPMPVVPPSKSGVARGRGRAFAVFAALGACGIATGIAVATRRGPVETGNGSAPVFAPPRAAETLPVEPGAAERLPATAMPFEHVPAPAEAPLPSAAVSAPAEPAPAETVAAVGVVPAGSAVTGASQALPLAGKRPKSLPAPSAEPAIKTGSARVPSVAAPSAASKKPSASAASSRPGVPVSAGAPAPSKSSPPGPILPSSGL
jgi:serine/threonine-protein kinase